MALREEKGETHAVPIRISGSGILSSLVRADGIVEIPEDREGIDAGEIVDVYLTRRTIGI